MASDPLIAVRETSRMKSLFSWNFLQKVTKRRGIVPLAPTISPTTSMELLDVNMLGEYPQTMRENTGILLEASIVGDSGEGEHAMVNIWTPQQKSQCVLWLAKEKSVTRVQPRVLRTRIGGLEDVNSLPGQPGWLFNDSVSTTRLFSIGEIGASDTFGAMRPKIRHRLLNIRFMVGENLGNNPIRRMRWAGHVARMGESRNAYRVLVGRSEGKSSLGRPRRRWEDNIEMDLRNVGYDDRDWINLAQDRDRWLAYVKAAMNLQVP
ncbi:hypothetical protein ANN_15307 [Periplaneta americana]|uniref:Uncharacterized protein n=1 Tax=Periplaneta americana TaxID=6978 RepID=A0ABQ8SHV8_PERAM|nr:hypothetical protein ANN_15307 [Periplaneta americana]